ncbi:MAG: hypothetical protein ACOYZ8_14995 [Chloroflexota bacterium]
MPHNIILDALPAGIALTSVRDGGDVKVAYREFTSSEDGDLFIQRLEGLTNEIIGKLPPEIKASMIDHMLVVIHRDKRATVYVNELNLILKIRPKRAINKKGESVFQDDIAEIERLSFENEIKISGDVGIIFVFSTGWRKGLFFDFGAFGQHPLPIIYDIEKLLGHYFAYLDFQHLFKLTDDEWEKLFSQMWFPFIALKTQTVQRMLNFAKSNIPVDDLLPKIVEEVESTTNDMLERWKNSSILVNHMELITRAVERYMQKDYISATSILYTRIEGIMRGVLQIANPDKKASAKNLAETITLQKETSDIGRNILLPRMFHKYLDEVYFRNFNPEQPEEISRHTIAHGVARPEDFSVKAATIGLLLIDQLFYFLPSKNS